MSPRRRILNPESLYFITITIVDWIALLNRPVYKHVIVDALNYCIRNKGLAVYAYVIMDNHIHFPTELVDNQMIDQKLNYIHENPVEAEIVSRAEDYKYSSANFYAGGFSEIIIECCL